MKKVKKYRFWNVKLYLFLLVNQISKKKIIFENKRVITG